MGQRQQALCLWVVGIMLAAAGCAEEIGVPFSNDTSSGSDSSGTTSGTSGTETDSLDDSNSTSGAEVTPWGCGDGTIQPPEACDDGPNNSDTNPNACRSDCTEAYCGDGVIDANETCDNGALNSDADPRACRTNCTQPRCGNGILEAGEQCDSGASNSDSAPDACRGSCVLPTCGDGVQDSGEGCDDGNTIDSDECANACISILSILCQPCTTDEECGRPIDTCETSASGQFCAVACDPDAADPCPLGYDCVVDDTEENRIGKCFPTAGECREVCGNGLDDDADTFVDCADSDCATTDPRCGSEICDDQFDNDSDTLTDCRDPDCIDAPVCQEDCTDNADNDLDTLTDCADIEDCADHPRCQDACASPTACTGLPAPTCANSTTLRTASVECVSNEGVATCTYPTTDTVCPNDGACVNGACVNPCAPSASAVCTSVPAPTCANSTTVTSYAPACTAAAGQPDCDYPGTNTPCGSGQACSGGVCVSPCNPNPCTSIPAAICVDDTTIRTYTSACSINGTAAVCDYPFTDTPCTGNNVCSGSSCVSPSSLPQPTQPGDVIFSEVMFYPNGSFQQKQWIEIYNTTNNTFNLGGCHMYNSGETFPINVTSQTLILSPGEYAVLNGSSLSGSGLPSIDFQYSGSSFVMNCNSGCGSNAAETLRLGCGTSGSLTIDQITYSPGAISSRGFSLNLDPESRNHTANDNQSNWCITSAVNYSLDPINTNRGTPGEANTQCP